MSKRTNFTGANFSNAVLTGKMPGTFDGVDFTNASLRHMDFKGSSFNNTDFTDADLAGTDLRDSNMQGAKISLNKCAGMQVSLTGLEGAVLVRPDGSEHTVSASDPNILAEMGLAGVRISAPAGTTIGNEVRAIMESKDIGATLFAAIKGQTSDMGTNGQQAAAEQVQAAAQEEPSPQRFEVAEAGPSGAGQLNAGQGIDHAALEAAREAAAGMSV